MGACRRTPAGGRTEGSRLLAGRLDLHRVLQPRRVVEQPQPPDPEGPERHPLDAPPGGPEMNRNQRLEIENARLAGDRNRLEEEVARLKLANIKVCAKHEELADY